MMFLVLGAGPAMESVASQLKSEREKRKIPLSRIAADTRISLRHLESLEEGRYSDLPGGMYNRAFLRAYCESLNLDQKDIMRRYEEEMRPPADKSPRLKSRIPRQNQPPQISPVIIWSILLLISAAGIFFSRDYIASIFSPYFSRAETPSVRFDPPKTVSPDPPASSAQPAAEQTGFSAANPENTPLSDVPPPAAALPAGAAADASLKDASVPFRMELVGTESCWISIDSDGSPTIRKLIEPGEVQSFSASESFLVVVGNAGGIHLKINGKQLKPLGHSGEVRRILIDQKSLPELLDPTAG